MIPKFFRKLFGDRRVASQQVDTDRRRRGIKAVESELDAAIERFSRTVIMRRSANDPQMVVKFETLAPICPDRGVVLAGVQMCRHEKAGAGQRCQQQTCPVIVGRTQNKTMVAA